MWEYLFIIMEEILSGYTCQTCGKIFETEEEFDNRHKKKNKKVEFKDND
jgi:DNA-directed RNA polymerase subunit RPC12/RpoP